MPALDEHLGGGLLPGTLTVVAGATGIGKTQLGLQFVQAGVAQEQQPGVILDVNCRVDSQSHEAYAERMFGRKFRPVDPDRRPNLDHFFDEANRPGDILRVFGISGRRVTRDDLAFDRWHDWQAELSAKLEATIAFFYGNFCRGVRRAVIDGIEPIDDPSQSIQFELIEYIYHQILRKEADWVARDLFRQHFRASADAVQQHIYDQRQVACLLLYTTHETLLDQMISSRLVEGDLLSGANTLIYMGKRFEGNRLTRGLFIAKHRGSRCSEEIIPYTINDAGLQLLS